MTRDEAIINLKLSQNRIGGIKKEEWNALQMAIEALKAEPNTSDRSDLIRRGDVNRAICEVCLDGESLYKGCKHHWNCPYLTKIGKIPTVSAEAVQGEWEHWGSPFSDESEVIDTIVCSVCGARFIEPKDEPKGEYNYCPNCGADMRGEEE